MTYKNFSLTSPGSRLSRGPTLYYAYALPIYMHTPYLSSHAPCKRIEQIIHTLLVVPLLSVSMETEDLLVIMCVTLIAAWWLHLLLKWSSGGHRRRRRCELTLPHGSMGLPLLGESLEFFARIPSLEVLPFFKRRLERYGNGIVNLIFVLTLWGAQYIKTLLNCMHVVEKFAHTIYKIFYSFHTKVQKFKL